MYDRFYPTLSDPTPKVFTPWVTWLLVLSTFAVFFVELYQAFTSSGVPVVITQLAFSGESWAENRWWTAVTCAWVHSLAIFGKPNLFWAHIVFNMIPLICFGPPLEKILGHFSFLVLYLGGAVAAALAWLTFSSIDLNQHVLGASGAVFAVMAGLATAAPSTRVIVFVLPFLPIHLPAGAWVLFAAVLEVISLILPSSIAHSAHVGGAIFGFLYVLIFHYLLGKGNAST